MLFLSKFLPLFFLPLGVGMGALLWGLTRRRRSFMWAGLAVLGVSSNPLVGFVTIRSAEGWADRVLVSEAPTADAIVVLSAGRIVAPGRERISEWTDADRFFGGVSLVQAGKAPLLVFTGVEGAVLADYAKRFGIPADRIAVTERVSNTADEAREVARLLHGRASGASRVLLVTSAFHIARARQLFIQQRLEVEPFPVDFSRSQGARWTPIDILPSVKALDQTQTALREFYGCAFYWLWARL